MVYAENCSLVGNVVRQLACDWKLLLACVCHLPRFRGGAQVHGAWLRPLCLPWLSAAYPAFPCAAAMTAPSPAPCRPPSSPWPCESAFSSRTSLVPATTSRSSMRRTQLYQTSTPKRARSGEILPPAETAKSARTCPSFCGLC